MKQFFPKGLMMSVVFGTLPLLSLIFAFVITSVTTTKVLDGVSGLEHTGEISKNGVTVNTSAGASPDASSVGKGYYVKTLTTNRNNK